MDLCPREVDILLECIVDLIELEIALLELGVLPE